MVDVELSVDELNIDAGKYFGEEAITIARVLYSVRTAKEAVYLSSLISELRWKNKLDPVEWVYIKTGLRLLTVVESSLNKKRVLTSVKYRMLIDLFLDEMITDSEKAVFNPYLYSKDVEKLKVVPDLSKCRLTRKTRKTEHNKGEKVVVIVDYDDKYDWEAVLGKNEKSEIVPEYYYCFKWLIQNAPKIIVYEEYASTSNVISFNNTYFSAADIIDLQNLIIKNNIDSVTLKDCFFENDVSIIITNKAYFYLDDSFFEGKLKIIGTGEINISGISFRNAVFWGDVILQNIRFEGDTNESSFEDALFVKNSEVLLIENCFFKNHSLSFYQTNFEKCDIELRNNTFVNMGLKFTSAYLMGRLSLYDNGVLPAIDMNFEYADCIEINNCEIHNTVRIRNIRSFIMQNVRRYGGFIVSDSNWNAAQSLKLHIGGAISNYEIEDVNYGDELNGCRMCLGKRLHPLLDAVGKNEVQDEKVDIGIGMLSSEYLLLRENFAQQGDYDTEDQAFLLYMRTRKDHRNYLIKLVYQLLDVIGEYGLSPLRILISFVILIFLMACMHLVGSFSIGNIPDSLYFALKNMISLSDEGIKISFLKILYMIILYLGWFLMGYFSVSVIRKTLRN